MFNENYFQKSIKKRIDGANIKSMVINLSGQNCCDEFHNLKQESYYGVSVTYKNYPVYCSGLSTRRKVSMLI